MRYGNPFALLVGVLAWLAFVTTSYGQVPAGRYVRTFELATAGAGAVTQNLNLTIGVSPIPSPATLVARSIVLINDGTNDVSINFETTATTVISLGGSNIRFRGTDPPMSISGVAIQSLSIIRLTGADSSVRAIVVY